MTVVWLIGAFLGLFYLAWTCDGLLRRIRVLEQQVEEFHDPLGH